MIYDSLLNFFAIIIIASILADVIIYTKCFVSLILHYS